MKRHLNIPLAVLLAIAMTPWACPAQSTTDSALQHIGIYDSRAIAVAYAGSAFQQKKMAELKEQHRQAKDSKNTKEVARLEALGKAWQAALHKQGFGTAPVDDLLQHIAGEIPRIQKAAGVTNLVSKWNQPELDRFKDARRIDVTMPLVDAFHPNATQRQRAIEIQSKPPVKMRD